MALDIALKIFLPMATGAAVVAPISCAVVSGTISPSTSITFIGGEFCKHLPIQNLDVNKKLLVCAKEGGDNKPTFKWWTKGDDSPKTQEIETLSWKKKGGEGVENVRPTFELEIKLNGLQTLKETGDDGTYYLPGVEFQNMGSICSLRIDGAKNDLNLICPEQNVERGAINHSIKTIDFT